MIKKCLFQKNFIKFEFRNFFILNAIRPSKNTDNMTSPKGLATDLDYINQMKEFMKESQGVPRNSQKWVELRNKHYRLLYDKSQEKLKTNFKESLDTQFLRFYLIIVPEETLCYEIVSILNYYNIKYKALEDSPVSKSIMKQMLGIFNKENTKNFAFPFLVFESSEEPKQNFDGSEKIIEFLRENNFIHDYRSNSVYEKEGVTFTQKFEKSFANEFKKFSNKFSFYFRVTNFKEARYWYHPHKDGYIYRSRIFSRIYRLGSDILSDFSYHFLTRAKTKNEISKKNVDEIILLVKDWILRMNENPFHGGDVPDAADFRLYAIYRKYMACRGINLMIKKFVKLESNKINVGKSIECTNIFTKFDDWASRMFLLCNRSSFYNIRDVGYNYNRFLSEEIIEQEKINKPLHETQFTSVKEKGNKQTANNIMGVFGNKLKRNKINI
jgi:hypothetical protein